MKKIVDVVNFNADASCLSSAKWLSCLSHGSKSILYQWLNNYVIHHKKVSLGFTAATISDIATFNKECIDLINTHRNIFEIILRPYSHDMGLFRSKQGFEINLAYGKRVIEKEFGQYIPYYLPPEFMLTNEQLFLLNEHKVEGTFIKPLRFAKEIKSRIPTEPYRVKGLYDSALNCISFDEFSYHAYLKTIQLYDSSWNDLILNQQQDILFSWRDGESPFFLNDTVKREAYWLQEEDKSIQRLFLQEVLPHISFESNEVLSENHYHYYPVHSITPWLREMKMMGYITRLQALESNIENFTALETHWWLQAINSDILSAVEKSSPVIQIKDDISQQAAHEYYIWRSERGMEGEEILSMLEFGIENERIHKYIHSTSSVHIKKLQSRIQYLNNL
ncbi:MAG: hypothetical protein WCP57_02050 [Bacteroidota bacterium]